jgi:hypothetical protein
MRKTEMVYGLFAGVLGIALGVLFLLDLLPHSQIVPYVHRPTYAIICIAANVVAIAGAIVVTKRNMIGAFIMAGAMIAVMLFGFPWQSIAAVPLTISVVLAMAPVKAHKELQKKTQVQTK